MEDLKITVAKNIADLRKAANMTQLDLASRLNYSDKAVSKWERGESLPDVVTLKTIADIFSVTVDYLLQQEHLQETAVIRRYSKRQHRNHAIITAMSSMLVWLIATFVFVNIDLISKEFHRHWLIFVYAVPVTAIVLLVFNSIWGRHTLNFVIISVLMWSTILSLCLILSFDNIWLTFVIGIPAQIIIALWSRLKSTKLGTIIQRASKNKS